MTHGAGCRGIMLLNTFDVCDAVHNTVFATMPPIFSPLTGAYPPGAGHHARLRPPRPRSLVGPAASPRSGRPTATRRGLRVALRRRGLFLRPTTGVQPPSQLKGQQPLDHSAQPGLPTPVSPPHAALLPGKNSLVRQKCPVGDPASQPYHAPGQTPSPIKRRASTRPATMGVTSLCVSHREFASRLHPQFPGRKELKGRIEIPHQSAVVARYQSPEACNRQHCPRGQHPSPSLRPPPPPHRRPPPVGPPGTPAPAPPPPPPSPTGRRCRPRPTGRRRFGPHGCHWMKSDRGRK